MRANGRDPTLTWIGHASFLIQLAGVNVLVDPQFSERASPVQFAGPKRIVAAILHSGARRVLVRRRGLTATQDVSHGGLRLDHGRQRRR